MPGGRKLKGTRAVSLKETSNHHIKIGSPVQLPGKIYREAETVKIYTVKMCTV